jgi:hypothetical protein
LIPWAHEWNAVQGRDGAVDWFSRVRVREDGKIDSDRFRESLSPQGHVNDWAGVFTPEQKRIWKPASRRCGNSGAQLAVVALTVAAGRGNQRFLRPSCLPNGASAKKARPTASCC